MYSLTFLLWVLISLVAFIPFESVRDIVCFSFYFHLQSLFDKFKFLGYSPFNFSLVFFGKFLKSIPIYPLFYQCRYLHLWFLYIIGSSVWQFSDFALPSISSLLLSCLSWADLSYDPWISLKFSKINIKNSTVTDLFTRWTTAILSNIISRF